MGKQPPRRARACTIPNGVHELSRVMLRFLEIRQPGWCRDKLGDERPLGIGQVGGVAAPRRTLQDGHTPGFDMTRLAGPNLLWNTLSARPRRCVPTLDARRG